MVVECFEALTWHGQLVSDQGTVLVVQKRHVNISHTKAPVSDTKIANLQLPFKVKSYQKNRRTVEQIDTRTSFVDK